MFHLQKLKGTAFWQIFFANLRHILRNFDSIRQTLYNVEYWNGRALGKLQHEKSFDVVNLLFASLNIESARQRALDW